MFHQLLHFIYGNFVNLCFVNYLPFRHPCCFINFNLWWNNIPGKHQYHYKRVVLNWRKKMRLVLILWMKFLRRTLFHFSSWSMARVLASLCAYQRGSSTSCFWSQVTAPKSSTLKAFVESRPCRCPPKFWFTSPTTSSFSGQNWRQSILKPNT